MDFKRTVLLIVTSVSFSGVAQVFDNSGNGKLNGKYYFREVIYTASDYVALYGNITFSSGTYTISGAQGLDCNASGCAGPSAYSPSPGAYTVSSSGYGFISNQLLASQVYGLVGANGVFVGSSTETGAIDLFVAAPVTSQSLSSLQGAYTLAYIDPAGAVTSGTPFDALLQMSPNGAGTIGTVNVSAYATSPTAVTQSITGGRYIVSNDAFKLTFPNAANALLVGDYYLYATPDGNFIFGGAPDGFDMIVGVRTAGSGSGLGGLYYQAGLDVDNSSGGFDSYYGTFNASNGLIAGHHRFQNGSPAATDITYQDKYQPGSNSYTDTGTSTQYIIGPGGVRIGLGLGPFLGISAAVPAANFSGSGVYLNPTGVVNAASFAPFTAGVSRGEAITLFGSNLGPSTLLAAATLPLPTTLGQVQVLINNVPAPLFYVSASQISAIVPWETTSSIAQIQVVNNGAASNTVTEFVRNTTPGAFGGLSYAAAQHADFSLVTPSSPAKVGETIAVYVTGLGDVSPPIANGGAGVVGATSNAIVVGVGSVSAPVVYSGLAPGLAGLYQLNITIPSGVTNGDNYLYIGSQDGTSYTTESLLPVTGGISPTGAPVRSARR